MWWCTTLSRGAGAPTASSAAARRRRGSVALTLVFESSAGGCGCADWCGRREGVGRSIRGCCIQQVGMDYREGCGMSRVKSGL